jgi:hypothetical protein
MKKKADSPKPMVKKLFKTQAHWRAWQTMKMGKP